MKVAIQKDGQTIVQLGPKTWIKLALLLGGLLYGNSQLQCSKIDGLSANVQELSGRVKATEQSVSDIRQEHRDTTREMRESIRDLNTFLRARQQQSATTPAAASLTLPSGPTASK